jgi:hypothetical protein
MKKKCKIRKDLIEDCFAVPIGIDCSNLDNEYEYRWSGEQFEIFYHNHWHAAESVDFEFN